MNELSRQLAWARANQEERAQMQQDTLRKLASTEGTAAFVELWQSLFDLLQESSSTLSLARLGASALSLSIQFASCFAPGLLQVESATRARGAWMSLLQYHLPRALRYIAPHRKDHLSLVEDAMLANCQERGVLLRVWDGWLLQGGEGRDALLEPLFFALALVDFYK